MDTLSMIGGEEFVNMYYMICDTQRHILCDFYSEQSKLIYNGTLINGKSQLKDFLTQLPITKHDIKAFDVQNIASEANNSAGCLVTVSGSVSYGMNTIQDFHEQFILIEGHDKFHSILSNNFRTSEQHITFKHHK